MPGNSLLNLCFGPDKPAFELTVNSTNDDLCFLTAEKLDRTKQYNSILNVLSLYMYMYMFGRQIRCLLH